MFLAATGTKVAVYAFIRVFFTVFGGVEVFNAGIIPEILAVLAALAMIGASAVAIHQTDVKRLLAYSSVAQIGYMVLGDRGINGP